MSFIFFEKEVTVGSVPVLLFGVYVYMFVVFNLETKKKEEGWTLPFLSLSLSLAPLSYLAERDDRRSEVSVNRAKRWRDGKMDSI